MRLGYAVCLALARFPSVIHPPLPAQVAMHENLRLLASRAEIIDEIEHVALKILPKSLWPYFHISHPDYIYILR